MARKAVVRNVDLERCLNETLAVYDGYSDGLQKDKIRIFVAQLLERIGSKQTFEEAMIAYRNRKGGLYV